MSLTKSQATAQINLAEMEQKLVTLLQRVKVGETLVVMEAGKPIAEIKPITSAPTQLRPFGLCAGEFTVPDDFDAPLPEDLVCEFEGR